MCARMRGSRMRTSTRGAAAGAADGARAVDDVGIARTAKCTPRNNALMLGFLFRKRRAAAAAQALAQGTLRLQQGAPAEARALLDRAATLDPDNPDILLVRGTALHALGRLPDAAADFERSLALAPHYAGAAYNLAHTLRSLGRRDDAIAALDQALAVRPDYPDAVNLRGVALTEQGRHADALAAFERLRAIAPHYPDVLGNIAYASAHVARWDARARVVPLIAQGIRSGERLAAPFVLLGVTDDPDLQLADARLYAPPVPPPMWAGERYGHGRIRIAYLSANFHDHAVAYLMAGVLEAHDRERFEVTGVSFGPPDADAMRKRLVAACDRFVDVRAQGDFDVARALREMEIDVAVDLMGHTGEARPGILARRPAPVQVSYLGYPGTMGVGCIDYLLADRFVIPESARAHYTEHVVYLPETFQANDDKRPRAATAPARGSLGLPDDAFVFCSFNNAYKITPEMFDAWMRVLAGSRAACCGSTAAIPRCRRSSRTKRRRAASIPRGWCSRPRRTMRRTSHATGAPTCSSTRCRSTAAPPRATRCGAGCRC